ncbi:MAG: hypothetical protein WD336_09695 [Trueperaceae bacterium]
MSEEAIRTFLNDMRSRHADQIDAIDLPDGTVEYIAGRVADGDVDTLTFMLKLGYLMGLQSGFAAGRSGDDEPDGSGPGGPMQA